jgi:hypothetical protein
VLKKSIGKAKADAAMRRRLDRGAEKARRKAARAADPWPVPRWFGVSQDYPYYE